MTTHDYHFMLESAKEHLDELPGLYYECLRENQVPKRLTNKIRYFLNDIESALDYIAYHIFNTYCIEYISDPNKIETKRKRVNFPLLDPKSWFDKRIEEMFPKLKSERPEIIVIFENCQPFVKGTDSWLPIFNRLVNNNKHRELEKQQKNQTTNVRFAQIGGITMVNCVIEGVGAPLNYNGTPVDFLTPSPLMKKVDATTFIDFTFKGTNMAVLPTLEKIYLGAQSVINELEKTF